MNSNKEEKKRLSRPELYIRILKFYKLKPAAKSPLNIAYFTTDHLRAINSHLEEVAKCQSVKIR